MLVDFFTSSVVVETCTKVGLSRQVDQLFESRCGKDQVPPSSTGSSGGEYKRGVQGFFS